MEPVVLLPDRINLQLRVLTAFPPPVLRDLQTLPVRHLIMEGQELLQGKATRQHLGRMMDLRVVVRVIQDLMTQTALLLAVTVEILTQVVQEIKPRSLMAQQQRNHLVTEVGPAQWDKEMEAVPHLRQAPIQILVHREMAVRDLTTEVTGTGAHQLRNQIHLLILPEQVELLPVKAQTQPHLPGWCRIALGLLPQ